MSERGLDWIIERGPHNAKLYFVLRLLKLLSSPDKGEGLRQDQLPMEMIGLV